MFAINSVVNYSSLLCSLFVFDGGLWMLVFADGL